MQLFWLNKKTPKPPHDQNPLQKYHDASSDFCSQ